MALVTFGLMPCFGIVQGNEYLVRFFFFFWGCKFKHKKHKKWFLGFVIVRF